MRSPYALARKRKHRPSETETLAVECMRKGLLDVCLVSGKVYTNFRGIIKERKQRVDHDGYCGFNLNVESSRGGYVEEGKSKSGKWFKRRRRRMYVQVHRLVLAKKLAVERFGEAWRERVRDIPLRFDIDHIDRDRSNNRGSNLRLRDWFNNRTDRPLTPEEEAAIDEFNRSW